MEPNKHHDERKHRSGSKGFIHAKQTLDRLLREKGAADLIALYTLYCYTALWQNTNQPHATLRYVMKRLKWGRDKARAARRELLKLRLIEDVVRRDESGCPTGCYVRVAYFRPIGPPENQEAPGSPIDPPDFTTGSSSHPVDFPPPNAS